MHAPNCGILSAMPYASLQAPQASTVSSSSCSMCSFWISSCMLWTRFSAARFSTSSSRFSLFDMGNSQPVPCWLPRRSIAGRLSSQSAKLLTGVKPARLLRLAKLVRFLVEQPLPSRLVRGFEVVFSSSGSFAVAPPSSGFGALAGVALAGVGSSTSASSSGTSSSSCHCGRTNFLPNCASCSASAAKQSASETASTSASVTAFPPPSRDDLRWFQGASFRTRVVLGVVSGRAWREHRGDGLREERRVPEERRLNKGARLGPSGGQVAVRVEAPRPPASLYTVRRRRRGHSLATCSVGQINEVASKTVAVGERVVGEDERLRAMAEVAEEQ
mmetsp:Transcript_37193/g.80979  ORF Transcript_37193/g.80979 Transcript_37193/m.80979 type:complete len:331 (+) Transcript_37193:219-1211(+)